MSSIGTGYDLSATTFSPDGRVFQIEYAAKAVENSGTSIGIRCCDGVVLGTEKIISSKLYESGAPSLSKNTNSRLYNINKNIGFVFSGLSSDAKALVRKARSEAQAYAGFYGKSIPIQLLAERLGAFMQTYTLYSHVRPFGVSIILSGTEYSQDRPVHHLFTIESSGYVAEYNAIAVGKGKTGAKTELEKLMSKDATHEETGFENMTCQAALTKIAKILYKTHDFGKDGEMMIELGWNVDEEEPIYTRSVSGNSIRQPPMFRPIPADIYESIVAAAKRSLDEDDEDEDDMSE